MYVCTYVPVATEGKQKVEQCITLPTHTQATPTTPRQAFPVERRTGEFYG